MASCSSRAAGLGLFHVLPQRGRRFPTDDPSRSQGSPHGVRLPPWPSLPGPFSRQSCPGVDGWGWGRKKKRPGGMAVRAYGHLWTARAKLLAGCGGELLLRLTGTIEQVKDISRRELLDHCLRHAEGDQPTLLHLDPRASRSRPLAYAPDMLVPVTRLSHRAVLRQEVVSKKNRVHRDTEACTVPLPQVNSTSAAQGAAVSPKEQDIERYNP